MTHSTVHLYLVTDTAPCGGPAGVVETALAAARAGVDMIQVRDHDASTRDLTTLSSRVVEALADADLRVPVVVDDRLDVALAAGAHGVHLGQSDLDPVAARRIADAAATLTGPPFHIGWSVSSVDEVRAAGELPRGTVDLLGIGPFRATPTKPDAAAPLGLDGVNAVTNEAWNISLPNVVIGGVKQEDVAPLVQAGARGVAVVSAICGQRDPYLATRVLRDALDRALDEGMGDPRDDALDDLPDDGDGGSR